MRNTTCVTIILSLLRRPRLTLACVFLSVVISLISAFGLELRSSLHELLPQHSPAVVELNRMMDRIGGLGLLMVVAEGPDVHANQRFMDDLAAKISAFPPGLIRSLQYRNDDVRQFYEDHILWYLTPDELRQLTERVERRVAYEKIKRTPFFIDLGAEEPSSSFDDIFERVKTSVTPPVATVDQYLGGEWGRMLIMLIRPFGSTVAFDSSQRLVEAVEKAVVELNPTSYGSVKIGMCGNIKSSIEEYETLRHDLLSTTLLCVVLVAFAIAAYFLRLRAVFLLGATLFVGIAWTFGLTRLVIGYLNVQTAFLGSIIVGTGINYGIILLGRYWEERRTGHGSLVAMERTLAAVLRPTLLAAGTTAVVFAILLAAHIRGLSQFGFIGATGVLWCWIATFIALPAMTLLTEQIRGLDRRPLPGMRRDSPFYLLGRFLERKSKEVSIVALFVMLLSLYAVLQFLPHAMEYDFTKMRNRTSIESGTEALEHRVSQLFHDSLTPAVVLLDHPDQGPAVCEAVRRQNERLPPTERRVGSCYTLLDLLPTDQEEKMSGITKMKTLVEQFRSLNVHALTVDDLPSGLAENFEDRNGQRGAVVFISPRADTLLTDGRNLLRFMDTIRIITLNDGTTLQATGEWAIYSDLVRIIRQDAPWLAIAALVGVIFFVIGVVRERILVVSIIVGLLWGVVVMIGLCAWLRIHVNFFNFIVLPLTIGMGVDYSINIAMRLREEQKNGIAHALRQSGAAVTLCSVTTMIGYAVLMMATNQALVTFGLAAVIGEVTCLFSALVVVPALIRIMWGRS